MFWRLQHARIVRAVIQTRALEYRAQGREQMQLNPGGRMIAENF